MVQLLVEVASEVLNDKVFKIHLRDGSVEIGKE